MGAFDQVDTSTESTDFARWMEHQRSAGADRALDLLESTPHSRVLEIGCGTGVDLTNIAQRAGHAVGIDRSVSMARATRARDDLGPASVVVSDGRHLPFASDRFDACWARAVLVHTTRPQDVVDEIARVIRPGARVVLSEPDHGSHIVATSEPEVFERIKQHRRTTFRDPLVGRRLAQLVIEAGLTVTHLWVTPVLHRSLGSARAAGGPFDVSVDAAVSASAISAEEAQRYLTSLEHLDEQGAFCFAGLAVSVAAMG